MRHGRVGCPADKVGGDIPLIHVFVESRKGKTWMPGIKPGTTSEACYSLTPCASSFARLALQYRRCAWNLYGVDYGLPHNGTPRTIAKLSQSRNQPKVICSISELRKPRLAGRNHGDALRSILRRLSRMRRLVEKVIPTFSLRATFATQRERQAALQQQQAKPPLPHQRSDCSDTQCKKGRWRCATVPSAHVRTKRGGGHRVS
jgi:hypothetical protein